MTEPTNCPKCGNPPSLGKVCARSGVYWSYRCSECDVFGKAQETRDEAASAWNAGPWQTRNQRRK